MKAKTLLQKLGNKLLGKKVNKPEVMQPPPNEKTPEITLLDRLGVIQLHEYWRN